MQLIQHQRAATYIIYLRHLFTHLWSSNTLERPIITMIAVYWSLQWLIRRKSWIKKFDNDFPDILHTLQTFNARKYWIFNCDKLLLNCMDLCYNSPCTGRHILKEIIFNGKLFWIFKPLNEWWYHVQKILVKCFRCEAKVISNL